MKNEEIESLIEELLEASQSYYQEEAPTMSDSDYDAKIGYLRNKTIDNEEYNEDVRVLKLLEGDVAGGSTPEGELVSHTAPMLSLGKSNSMEAIRRYITVLASKGATGFTFQAKLDGYAISAIYKNGELVQVSTRGDGNVGQNMSYLIDNDEVSIVGLPKHLNQNSDYELRGELFLRNSQFDEVNKARMEATGSTFKNSRNAVVGITRKAEQGLGYNVELTFSVYTLMENNVYTNLDVLHQYEPELVLIDTLSADEWRKQGGQGRLESDTNIASIHDKIKEFGEYRPFFDIPTDGVVLKPYDESYFYETLGHTAHHPSAFTAFKYPAEALNTTIKAFTISVGKTGRLTPVAIVDPVDIGGTTITRVSCHNFNYIYTKELRVGAVVSVGRANDVIPKIMNVIVSGENEMPEVPKVCPECGASLISDDKEYPAKTLKCPNEECPSRLFFFMKGVVGKQALDIEGLNKVSLEGIINAGLIRDVDSLFALTEDKLSKVVVGKTAKGNDRKLGKIRAKKIIENINYARLHTPAYKMLNSLGFLNLGPVIAKKLLAETGSIDSVLSLTENELANIEGFADTRIDSFVSQREHANEVYRRLIARGVIMNDPERIKTSGQSFSLSGTVPSGFGNRNDFVSHMESLGWTYNSAPNVNTTVMFGDKDSSSSKIKKAEKYGIRIIKSLDEL